MSYIHLIVIRYNLPKMFGALANHNGVATADEEWLRHRQPIFENFTLSSLSNQENKNFLAIVLYDVNSPDWLRQRNEELKSQYSFFEPLYVVSLVEGEKLIDQLVLKRQRELGLTHVIATRLDNDDALHRKAIQSVQQKFDHQNFSVLNFIGIAILSLFPHESLNYRIYRGGPFVSMIVRISEDFHLPLFDKMHGNWRKEMKVIQIGPFPYAMQIIHGRNLSNRVHGVPILSSKLGSYGLSYKLNRPYFGRVVDFLKPIFSMNFGR